MPVKTGGSSVKDIDNPTSINLAERAIQSLNSEKGKNGKDGISYLISLKKLEDTFIE